MSKHMIDIHGYKVYCESDREYYGLKCLKYEMDDDASRELLKQAEDQREAHFEDHDHRKFTLIDGENGTFTVVRSEHSGGFF